MKRKYNRPVVSVIALQQQLHLLAGSEQGMRGEISGYSTSSGGFSQDDESTED